MKNRYTILLFLTIIISSCQIDPCQDKKTFMEVVSETVQQAREEATSLSEEEWKKLDEKMESLYDECYDNHEDQFTEKERRQMAREASKYVIVRNKDKFKDALEELDIDAIQEELSEVIGDVRLEFKEVFNDEVKEELRLAVDELKDELSFLKDDLKGAWEELKAEWDREINQ